MKKLLTLCLLSLSLAALPTYAKPEKKDDKKAENKKEDAKPPQKRLIKYTAKISAGPLGAKEEDAQAVKSALLVVTEFSCKGVKLEGKELVADLQINNGKLNKSDVSRALKNKKQYKVESLDMVEDNEKDVAAEEEKKKKEEKGKEKKDK